MSRFRFSLDRVLEIRTSQERAAAAALASANARLAASGSVLDGLVEDLRSVRQSVSEGGLDPGMANPLAVGLRVAIGKAVRDRDLSQDEASRCLTAWQEARRQKELLEKLRQTRLDEFVVASQRIQDASLDEWAVQRHVST
jgi:flagellar export protein FliJ